MGTRLKKYLKKLKKHAINGEKIVQNKLYSLVYNNNPVGCTFYYLDQVYAREKTLMLEKGSDDSSSWKEICYEFKKLNDIIV